MHATQSTAPMTGSFSSPEAPVDASMASNAAGTVFLSAAATTRSTPATPAVVVGVVVVGDGEDGVGDGEDGVGGGGAVSAGGVGVGGAAPAVSASVTSQSDDDDSSWGGTPSDLENPSELRRSDSNSSISTLGSTSTSSSTWPNEGFATPARADIGRGSSGGGRYATRSRGGTGGGGSMGGCGSIDGSRTPASLGAATPGGIEVGTPSPRSASGSSHGTPHVRISWGVSFKSLVRSFYLGRFGVFGRVERRGRVLRC